MINPSLRYKHDCKCCHYLGTINYPAPLSEGHEQRTADLYICKQTLVARFSSESHDYASADVADIPRYMRRGNDQSTAGPSLIAAYWFAIGKLLISHQP